VTTADKGRPGARFHGRYQVEIVFAQPEPKDAIVVEGNEIVLEDDGVAFRFLNYAQERSLGAR
jgi:hypothetical protein